VKHFRRSILIAVGATLLIARFGTAAMMTPITSPAGFNSAVTYVDHFEADPTAARPQDTEHFKFEESALVGLSSLWTDSVTPSGEKGIVEPTANAPLRFEFDQPATEVGMWFGNDDFGRVFDAKLELFNAANVSLGFVLVRSNGNDQADQFIGARSAAGAKYAQVSYNQPTAQLLTVYIDDLKVGFVPEPAGALLTVCGCLGIALLVRRPRLG
jgi:hypothetical protein